MRKKGFTLIELLVVISIIALQKAKAGAKALVCRTNQKNLLNAFFGYYMDNNDKALASTGAYDFWFLQIGPYLSDDAFTKADYENVGGTGYPKDPESTMKSSMAINKCPTTKPPENEWDPSQPPWSPVNSAAGTARNQYRYHMVRVEGSYAMNRWAGGWGAEEGGDFDPDTRMGKANLAKSYRNAAPGRGTIPLLADAIWVDAMPMTNKDAVPNEEELETGLWDGVGRYVTNRHGMDTNVAYCDGHVEKVKLNELWAQRWHKEFIPDRDVVVPRDRGE
ncbi:MAG: type II secretion system protein [Planctomycetota bacterium]|jgi:prepilin-type N-terminal cleavage/methylation domain-containing protein/prepilin-type processing-associated H-X9-DG protein